MYMHMCMYMNMTCTARCMRRVGAWSAFAPRQPDARTQRPLRCRGGVAGSCPRACAAAALVNRASCSSRTRDAPSS